MTEIVAYCGLTCQTCPIYLATRQENKEEQARMRAEIVQLCKEQYGMNYELEDIAHEGNPVHPELVDWAAQHGYEIAYDGLTV